MEDKSSGANLSNDENEYEEVIPPSSMKWTPQKNFELVCLTKH